MSIKKFFDQSSDSRKYLTETIKLNPNFSFAHRELTRITKYKKEDQHFIQLKNLYNKADLKDDINKMNLAFALGKANEDIENFDLDTYLNGLLGI